MKKKFLSVILCLCMVMTLLPGTALATQTTGLDFTSGGTPDVGNGYSWNSATSTLTLYGVDISVSSGSAIKLPGGSTIELVGYNKLTASGSNAGDVPLQFAGDLTIGGSGILKTAGGHSAIFANSASDALTVTGGYIKADRTINVGCMTVEGGYVDVACSSSGGSVKNGIYVTTTYTQSAGYVKLAAESGHDGLRTWSGKITVSGGYLEATGNHGISSNSGSVTNSGGVIKATGTNGNGIKIALTANSGVTIATGSGSNAGVSGDISHYGETVWERTGEAGTYDANTYKEVTLDDNYKTDKSSIVVAKAAHATAQALGTTLDSVYIDYSESTAQSFTQNTTITGGSYIKNNASSAAGCTIAANAALTGTLVSEGPWYGIQANSDSSYSGSGTLVGIGFASPNNGIDIPSGNISGGHVIGVGGHDSSSDSGGVFCKDITGGSVIGVSGGYGVNCKAISNASVTGVASGAFDGVFCDSIANSKVSGSSSTGVGVSVDAYRTDKFITGSTTVVGAYSVNRSKAITCNEVTDTGLAVKGASGLSGTFKNATFSSKTYQVDSSDAKVVYIAKAPHSHGSWSYAVGIGDNANKITATCGETGCDTTPYSETLTIAAPALTTYGGSESANATLTYSNSGTTVGGVTPTIQYAKKNASNTYDNIDSAPTDAGDYKASVTVGEKTAFVEYTVGKGTLVIDGTLTATASYGTAVKNITVSGATVKLGSASGTTVNGTWAFPSSENGIPNVGSTTAYAATFTPTTGAGNYNVLTQSVTPTISKVGYTGTKTATDFVYSGRVTTDKTLTLPALPAGASYAASGTVSGTTALISSHSVSGNTLTYSTTSQNNGTSATFTISVTGATNYNDYDVDVTISVSDKTDVSGQITFENGSTDYNGAVQTHETATMDASVTGGNFTYAYATTNGALEGGKPKVAGTYTVTATYEGDTALGVKTAAFTINKATITITAKDKNTYVGDAVPALGTMLGTDYTVTGLAGGDVLGGAIQLTYEPENPLMTTAGTAAINISGMTAPNDDNYNTIVYVPGTLTISNRSSGGGGGGTPSLVTEIKPGGSTTGSNLDRLISGNKGLTVTGADGAKLVFDTEALKGIGGQTTGSVTVKIEDVTEAHQTKQDGKNVFSLTVESGGKTISDFGGKVTVSLPYELKNGEQAEDVTVWYLAPDGAMTEIPCTYDVKTGLATFTTSHFSEYVVGVDSEWVNPFTDVIESDWFYGDVAFVAEKGLMSGVSATTFAPHADTSRGMIVTILYRLEGEPAVTGANPFDDVANGKYYTNAIIWAVQNSIIGGYGDGKFGPDDNITREQMAAILYRYAQYKSYDVSVGEDTNILSYADAEDIGEYAIPAMQWACGAGLVNGDGDKLTPQGNATRAQAAAILHRFIENVVK